MFQVVAISDLSISRDSVAMHLRFGGIHNNDIIANLLTNLSVKEF